MCFHTNYFVAHRYFVKNLSLNDNIFRYMSTSLNPPFVLSPTAVLYDSKCTPHFHKKLIHSFCIESLAQNGIGITDNEP